MKSLNIDIIVPWEFGLAIIILGLILIIFGVRQSKKEVDDFDKIPLIKPTTKIFSEPFFVYLGLFKCYHY